MAHPEAVWDLLLCSGVLANTTTLSAFLVAALAAGACGNSPSDSPDAGAGVDGGAALDAGFADAGPTYSDGDWLFEPDRLLVIDIEIDVDNWDILRAQSRDILSIFGDTCGEEPAYSPFTYVPATVTIAGERITEVGIRKKGFLGSLDADKPSLKIKFDAYRADQLLSGLRRMTLNNNMQDPGQMDQCLGYQLFARAGLPTPRCNFATVSVNGTPLGVYTHVEAIKKPFIELHFGDDSGNLYEGTLSDFRAGWTATFERKTNESAPPGAEDRSDIDAIVAALDLGDAAMLSAMEGLIDLDAFYSFWAIETMVSHWDGYAGNNNNFYLYGDPLSGKFAFMPWGTDQLFGNPSADPGLTRSVLTRRLFLYPTSRQEYLTRYEEILDEIWDDDEILAEIDRIDALIAMHVPPAAAPDYITALAELRAAIDGREQRMRNELATTSVNDADALAEPMCFIDVGTMTASFSVLWNGGAWSAATMAVTVDETALPLSSPRVIAGPSEDVPDQSILYFAAETSGNRTIIAYVALPDARVAPGVIEIGDGVESALLVFVEGVEDPTAIYFASGTMTLTGGAAAPGSTWQGSLDLRLWLPPWW